MAHAFYDDPFFRFVIPNVTKRTRVLPWLFEKLLRYGQSYGCVYTTFEVDGVAMCLGPSHFAFNTTGALRTGLFLLPLKLTWQEMRRIIILSDYTEQLHKRLVTEPHWYLYGVGVKPSRQGQEVGSALLRQVLVRADRDALTCYLDTTNEKNLPFYERLGFKVAACEQATRKSPQVWAMVREGRLRI